MSLGEKNASSPCLAGAKEKKTGGIKRWQSAVARGPPDNVSQMEATVVVLLLPALVL